MTKYIAFMIGEDGTEFSVEVDADTRREALAEIEEMYPEAVVDELDDAKERSNRAFDRAQAMYDNPDLDDYDY